jgi:hypothetical protein
MLNVRPRVWLALSVATELTWSRRYAAQRKDLVP